MTEVGGNHNSVGGILEDHFQGFPELLLLGCVNAADKDRHDLDVVVAQSRTLDHLVDVRKLHFNAMLVLVGFDGHYFQTSGRFQHLDVITVKGQLAEGGIVVVASRDCTPVDVDMVSWAKDDDTLTVQWKEVSPVRWERRKRGPRSQHAFERSHAL